MLYYNLIWGCMKCLQMDDTVGNCKLKFIMYVFNKEGNLFHVLQLIKIYDWWDIICAI